MDSWVDGFVEPEWVRLDVMFPGLLEENDEHTNRVESMELYDKNNPFPMETDGASFQIKIKARVYMDDDNQKILLSFNIKNSTLTIHKLGKKGHMIKEKDRILSTKKIKIMLRRLLKKVTYIKYYLNNCSIEMSEYCIKAEKIHHAKLLSVPDRYMVDVYSTEKGIGNPLTFKFTNDKKMNRLPINILLFDTLSTQFPETNENKKYKEKLFATLFKRKKTLNKNMIDHKQFRNIRIVFENIPRKLLDL